MAYVLFSQLSTIILFVACRLSVRCFIFTYWFTVTAASESVDVMVQFADDINDKVSERVDIVRELKETIVRAFNRGTQPSQEILKCCPVEPLKLRNNPRFAFPVTDFINDSKINDVNLKTLSCLKTVLRRFSRCLGLVLTVSVLVMVLLDVLLWNLLTQLQKKVFPCMM